MEGSLINKRERLQALSSELTSSLEAVTHLTHSTTSSEYNFEIGETLYAFSAISQTDRVGLWLGAGVMLEFEIPEAIGFLDNKLKDRQKEIDHCDHDLEFVRRQITTMEVNIARCYNWMLANKSK